MRKYTPSGPKDGPKASRTRRKPSRGFMVVQRPVPPLVRRNAVARLYGRDASVRSGDERCDVCGQRVRPGSVWFASCDRDGRWMRFGHPSCISRVWCWDEGWQFDNLPLPPEAAQERPWGSLWLQRLDLWEPSGKDREARRHAEAELLIRPEDEEELDRVGRVLARLYGRER